MPSSEKNTGLAGKFSRRWKRTSLLCGLLLLNVALCVAENPVVPKLTGIVVFPTHTAALLEWQEGRGQQVAPILREGERQAPCEVTKIADKEGIVSLRVANLDRDIDLQIVPARPLAGRTLHFQNADLQQVLEVYQQFSGCTILRSPALTQARMSFQSEANLSASNAVALLEAELTKAGVLVNRQGKFSFVTRPEEGLIVDSLPLPPTAATTAQAPGKMELFPAGLIKFQDADPVQVLDVYAELADRTMLSNSSTKPLKITVRTQTSLTRPEAVWVLDALLRLGGIAMLPEAKRFVYAVAPSQTNELPHFSEEGAKGKIKKPMQAAEIKFWDANLSQVLGIYAELSGRTALPIAATLPQARLGIRSRSLTQAETIFALEGLAAANNLAFQLVGDDKVAIVPALASSK